MIVRNGVPTTKTTRKKKSVPILGTANKAVAWIVSSCLNFTVAKLDEVMMCCPCSPSTTPSKRKKANLEEGSNVV